MPQNRRDHDRGDSNESSAAKLLRLIHHDMCQMDLKLTELAASLSRLERYQHTMMRVLRRTEREVLVAYEAELEAAEAEAAANESQEESAELVLKAVTDLVASLKTAQTDPATAKRITDLTTRLSSMRGKLATAIASVPTE